MLHIAKKKKIHVTGAKFVILKLKFYFCQICQICLSWKNPNDVANRVFHDKIKFYILSQNLHQTCPDDSRNDQFKKNEMVHETKIC